MERIHEFLENGASIEIGAFTIRELKDGSFFIKHESGEGMQASADLLEECIYEFYKENF